MGQQVNNGITHSVESIINRIEEVKSEIEKMSSLYEELDKLTMQLNGSVAVGEELLTKNGNTIILKDNFQDKNTVFRPAAVKRFEVELLTPEELQKQKDKEAKKAKKAAKTAEEA